MQLTRVLTAALTLAGSSLAQSAGPAMKWPDIGIYGGYQGWDLWRSKFTSRPGGELLKGVVLGVRASFDVTRRFAIEGAYGYGSNNFRVFPDGSGPSRPAQIWLGARNHHVFLNPVWHFMNSESKWRPYLTGGIGAISFQPTDSARRDISPPINYAAVRSNLQAALNSGGGVKYALTPKMQLRFDACNILTRQPHLGIPTNPLSPGAVFIAPGGTASCLQATAGIGFTLGGEARQAPPRPSPPRYRGQRHPTTAWAGAKRCA